MPHPIAVFDLDGTLVDTAPDLIATLNVVLEADGHPRLPAADARGMIGSGARAMIVAALTEAGADTADETVEPMLARFLDHYNANIAVESRPFPGLEAALDRLAQAGVTLAVCTNKYEGLSRKLLQELGLADRFAAIVGADTLGMRKPDPRHLLGTIEAAGGDAGRAVMVGDSRIDVAAAKAAGVPVVAVSFGYNEAPAETLGADHVIAHYDALWEAAAPYFALATA